MTNVKAFTIDLNHPTKTIVEQTTEALSIPFVAKTNTCWDFFGRSKNTSPFWYRIEWDNHTAFGYHTGSHWCFLSASDWYYGEPADVRLLIVGSIETGSMAFQGCSLARASVICQNEITQNFDFRGWFGTWSHYERCLIVIDGETLLDCVIGRPGRWGDKTE